MAKIQEGVNIEESLLSSINEIIPSPNGLGGTNKLEILLQFVRNNYNYSSYTVENMFTAQETMYLLQAFNSTVIEYNLDLLKKYLIRNVREFNLYGSIGFFSDEDPYKSLIEKLESITEFQALVILNSVNNFWIKKLSNPDLQPTDLNICKKDN